MTIERADWRLVRQQVDNVQEQVAELVNSYIRNVSREEMVKVIACHQSRFLENSEPLKKIVDRDKAFRKLLDHDLLGYFALISSLMEYMKENQEAALSSIVIRSRIMHLMVEAFRFYVPGEKMKVEEVPLRYFLKKNKSIFDDTIKCYDYESKNTITMLQLELPEKEIYAVLNPSLFLLLLINLCRNARDHGEAQKIYISLLEKDTYVQVEVSDNGKGIDECMSDKVFRGGVSTGNGYGLGLADAQRKMKTMKGAIQCLPHDGINGGAKFILEFSKT